MADKAALGKHLYSMYSWWTRTDLLLGRRSDTPSPALTAQSDLYEVEAPAGKPPQTEFRHVQKAGGWVDSLGTNMQSEGDQASQSECIITEDEVWLTDQDSATGWGREERGSSVYNVLAHENNVTGI